MARGKIATNTKKSLLVLQHFVLPIDGCNSPADLLCGSLHMIIVTRSIPVHNLNADATGLHVIHFVLHVLLKHQIAGNIDAALA